MRKLHIAIIIIGIVFISLSAFHENIWFDECYSVGIASQSYGDIWTIGGNDVHPILYYWMLKTLSLVFGNSILAFRLFSIIPIAILAVLGFTHIRKDFGEKCGLIFSFLILFLPEMTRYATEIRMYSWAMLFTSITAIYAYRLYKQKFDNKNLVIFGIFSLLGAYTHYYGLMASGIINLLLFIYLLKNLHNKKSELIKFIIVAIVQLALYMPWMVCFLTQLNNVSHGFWIGLSFPDTLIEVINMQYCNKLNKYLAFGFAIVLYTYIGILIFKASKQKDEIKPGLFGIAIYVSIIIAALLISLIISQAILLNRYLLVVTGLLAFSLSYFMAKEKNKYITIGICSFVLILSTFNNYYTIRENYDSTNKEVIEYINENIKSDDLILYGNEGSGFVVGTRLRENKQYFYDHENWHVEKAYAAFGPNMEEIYDLKPLENYSRKDMGNKFF